jgi:hypothetical protein
MVTLFSFLLTLSAYAIITSPISNDFNSAGTLTRKDKVFIKIRNKSGASLASGSVVVWDTTFDDGASVTTTTTVGAQNVACVVGGQAIAANAVGLCQVYGLHQYVKFSTGRTSAITGGTSTAGSFVFASSDKGYAVGLDTATHTAVHKPFGTFLDSESAGTSQAEVFINLL